MALKKDDSTPTRVRKNPSELTAEESSAGITPLDANYMKYEKAPPEERVPDENNGPQIGETQETYQGHSRNGAPAQSLVVNPDEPTAPPAPPARDQRPPELR